MLTQYMNSVKILKERSQRIFNFIGISFTAEIFFIFILMNYIHKKVSNFFSKQFCVKTRPYKSIMWCVLSVLYNRGLIHFIPTRSFLTPFSEKNIHYYIQLKRNWTMKRIPINLYALWLHVLSKFRSDWNIMSRDMKDEKYQVFFFSIYEHDLYTGSRKNIELW